MNVCVFSLWGSAPHDSTGYVLGITGNVWHGIFMFDVVVRTRQAMKAAAPVPAAALKLPGDKVISRKAALLDSFFDKQKAALLPRTYSRNSTKEETLLEYVEDFRRQYVQLFPHRRPLFLCPLNESGIRKFVSTTLHPSQLPYHQMHNLKDIVTFVADFLEYMPLDDPVKLPEYLPSPATVARLRVGDSFDFSTFLCSLLRGAGFNAYCVSGYAPQWITTMDESGQDCPAELLLEEERSEEEDEPADPKLAGRYQLKHRIAHHSKYLEDREREAREKEEARIRPPPAAERPVPESESDPLYGQRVHCWVLVLKGKREQAQDVFIEPTTGRIWPIDQSPYLGVESVWNEANYWANVQEEYGVLLSPQAMSYDLSDTDSWEYVLIDEKAETKGEHDFDNVNKEDADRILSPEPAQDGRDILDAPVSWSERIVIDRESFQQRFPKRSKRVVYEGCVVEKFAERLEGHEELLLRVSLYDSAPYTRETLREVRELFGPRVDKLEKRVTYPRESKVQEFFRPGRETCLKALITLGDRSRVYEFYPGARDDGMVRREEIFGLKNVETFEGRDDFLVYRSVAFDTDSDGSKPTLFSLEDVRGKVKRDLPVRKITEKFARDPSKPAEADVRKRTHFVGDQTIRLDYHYGPSRITHSVELVDKADKDAVAGTGSSSLDPDDLYSAGWAGAGAGAGSGSGGGSGAGMRTAPGSKSLVHRVDPDWKRPSAGQQREEIARLLNLEKRLMAEVREEEDKVRAAMQALELEKKAAEPEKSIYDLAREQAAKESKGMAKEAATEEGTDAAAGTEVPKTKMDYLTPFLMNYANYMAGKPLTRAQALRAKEDCLQALKDRLLDRAAIIQQHLDRENHELHLKQQEFKRKAGAGAVEADEEFTKYYEKAMFRIDILKSRLARHGQLALAEYTALDEVLRADPRLAVIYQ